MEENKIVNVTKINDIRTQDNKIVCKEIFCFKNYYYDNPDFRERHLAKMREKITCECGCLVSRSNFSKHQNNKKHFRRMVEKSGNQELKKKIDDLDIIYKMGLEDAKKTFLKK